MEFLRGRYSYYYRCPECGFRISAREASRLRSALKSAADGSELEKGMRGSSGSISFAVADIRPPFYIISICRTPKTGN